MPVSLFTAPIGEITADDVNAFLDGKIEEGVRLDYKEAEKNQHGVPKSITNEVVAFSNTYGGLIIVGVGVDRSTNRPTTREGVILLSRASLEEQVTSFCYGNIVPPVVPEIRVCPFKAADGSDRAFVVLRVQPSPTVHATRENAVLVRAGSENPNADLRTLLLLFERQQQQEKLVEQTRAIAWRGHLSTRKFLQNDEVEPWKPGDDRIYIEFIPLDKATDLLPFESTFPGMDTLDHIIGDTLSTLAWKGTQGNKVMKKCGEPLPLQRGLGFISHWYKPHIDPVPASALYFDRSGSMAFDLVERGFTSRKNQQIAQNKDSDVYFLFAAIVEMSDVLCGLLRMNGYSGRIETRTWATNVLGRTLPATENLEHYGEATFSLLDPKKDRSMKLGVMVNRLTRTWWKHTVKLDDFINTYSPTFVQEEPF